MTTLGPLFLLGTVINVVLWVFTALLLARMVLSWMPIVVQGWNPRGAVLVFAEAVYTVTDPPLRLFRKFLPPVRVGQVSFDLAFLGLWFAVILLRVLNEQLLMR
ncbi:YggT family protein [Naumannella cuiyingiana]|uniref:YggT family protein n=1 Tax=Naumannella cuiyingiana TaxID=1347891 RepID=A0A7Z0DB66_9ACTN|nr:YggT family protein [Naumannella cuiyingiana]NYI72106.1 YggT family protein [Naumannella cuiyingiana]